MLGSYRGLTAHIATVAALLIFSLVSIAPAQEHGRPPAGIINLAEFHNTAYAADSSEPSQAEKVLEGIQKGAEVVSTVATGASPVVPQAGIVAGISAIVVSILAAIREALKTSRLKRELELEKLRNKSPPSKGNT